MCLGVSGKVIETYECDGVPMGKLYFGGVVKEVCLAYVPDIQLGQFAIVHVGFAITKLDEEAAEETLELLRQMGLFEEEYGVPPHLLSSRYSFQAATLAALPYTAL